MKHDFTKFKFSKKFKIELKKKKLHRTQAWVNSILTHNLYTSFHVCVCVCVYIYIYTRYNLRPIGPWALARTFSRTKTEPKPHSKSILFWLHDKQAMSGQLWLARGCVCSEQPMSPVTRYCLEEYRCRVILWRQKSIPMPLPLFPMEHIPCQE